MLMLLETNHLDHHQLAKRSNGLAFQWKYHIFQQYLMKMVN